MYPMNLSTPVAVGSCGAGARVPVGSRLIYFNTTRFDSIWSRIFSPCDFCEASRSMPLLEQHLREITPRCLAAQSLIVPGANELRTHPSVMHIASNHITHAHTYLTSHHVKSTTRPSTHTYTHAHNRLVLNPHEIAGGHWLTRQRGASSPPSRSAAGGCPCYPLAACAAPARLAACAGPVTAAPCAQPARARRRA